MTQSIAIMILGSPYGESSTQTALSFSQAVLEKGHDIEQVFFYHEAVSMASNLTVSSQDETNLPAQWQKFIRDHNISASVCIASSLKRGIINSSEAKRYKKPANNLCGDIEISGLGSWIAAVNNADKSIVFGH